MKKEELTIEQMALARFPYEDGNLEDDINAYKRSIFIDGAVQQANLDKSKAKELEKILVSTFLKYGDKTALLIKGKRSYTGNEIAEEIKNGTELGIQMMENILKLSINLLMRDKINISETE